MTADRDRTRVELAETRADADKHAKALASLQQVLQHFQQGNILLCGGDVMF